MIEVDIIEFLEARHDDDAADAKARRGVFPSPTVDEKGNVWLHIRPDGQAVLTRYLNPDEGYDDMAKLHDWARPRCGWTADRALRQVDAHRRLLEGHGPSKEIAGYETVCSCDDPWPCRTVRNLASIYSDHPDYREDWRP